MVERYPDTRVLKPAAEVRFSVFSRSASVPLCVTWKKPKGKNGWPSTSTRPFTTAGLPAPVKGVGICANAAAANRNGTAHMIPTISLLPRALMRHSRLVLGWLTKSPSPGPALRELSKAILRNDIAVPGHPGCKETLIGLPAHGCKAFATRHPRQIAESVLSPPAACDGTARIPNGRCHPGVI